MTSIHNILEERISNKKFFPNLKPFQKSEYIFLALFAFFVPISWRIATYVMIGLFISCILKGIFEEGFKINKLQYKNKAVYFISMAFWAIYAVSFLYSDNSIEARIQIGKKLSFLLFPLFFLTSDLSYLTKEKVRTIMYCFVSGILTLFIVNLIWAGYDVIFNEKDPIRITSYYKFFKTNAVLETPHRAHFSMFTCLGLVFCFTEFFKSKSIKIKIFNFISAVILFILPFFVTSRAGILCMILLFIILLSWLIFIKKETKTGIIAGLTILSFLMISYFAFPKSINRFTEAIDKVRDGNGDIRLTLRNSCKNILEENLIFGVGVGDRNDITMKAHYEYRDQLTTDILNAVNADSLFLQKGDKELYCEYADTTYKYVNDLFDKDKYAFIHDDLAEFRSIGNCIIRKLNAHNQYSDTIIAVGILGLIPLLVLFLAPVYLWIKNKKFDIIFFSLLFIITFNCLFESVFERQMGIMFFAFFYFLFFHADFCQQKADNNLEINE